MTTGIGHKIIVSGVRRIVRTDAEGNALVYYTGVISSSIAQDITFVPVMKDLATQKSPLHQVSDGYQRPGSLPRMKQFARFLSETPLAIVPPVLLSTRDKWSFDAKKDKDFGDLIVSGRAAIIDGQHRMGGFISLYLSDEIVRDIDFVAYDGLTPDVEAHVFNTINGNAKGVQKGIGRVIEGSWSTKVVLMLKEIPGSPFYEKIFIAQRSGTAGSLFNLASFDKEVKKTFGHGSFSNIVADENIELMYEIMQKYWDIIAENFPVEWADIHEKPKDQQFKLLELTGIIAFSLAAGDILGPNFDPETLIMDWQQVNNLISALASSGYLDFRKDGEFASATGAVGGPKIHRKIQMALAALNQS